jgi:hypothetical protein
MHDDAVCALALANFHKPRPVPIFYSFWGHSLELKTQKQE